MTSSTRSATRKPRFSAVSRHLMPELFIRRMRLASVLALEPMTLLMSAALSRYFSAREWS